MSRSVVMVSPSELSSRKVRRSTFGFAWTEFSTDQRRELEPPSNSPNDVVCESLGLKLCEYTLFFFFMDLMFLSDDSLLNYRILCLFGIEQSNSVFQLELGALPLKLQAYKDLGLSGSFMVKIIICSPFVLIDVDTKFIKVVEILRSMGFI
ncbi:hypothetical protein GQ457_13G011570 [Hibiscus cannabinus]